MALRVSPTRSFVILMFVAKKWLHLSPTIRTREVPSQHSNKPKQIQGSLWAPPWHGPANYPLHPRHPKLDDLQSCCPCPERQRVLFFLSFWMLFWPCPPPLCQ